MNTNSSCNEIYGEAFDSHPNCYYKSGFCDLLTDNRHLYQTLKGLFLIYEVKDFASATSIKQVFQTAKICGGDYTEKLYEAMRDFFYSQE